MVDPNLDQTIKNYVFELAKELSISPGEGEFFDDSDLIALIRNCPIIYDRNLPDYKSDVKKAFFWNAIAEVFGVDKEAITSRWVNLRCYYGRHRTSLEKTHIAELSFLDPFVLSRNRTSRSMILEMEQQGMLSNLIQSVKKRPELYIKKTLIEGDIDTKIKNAWLQVATETGFSVDHCQKKWLYLREMYSRTKKSQDKGIEKNFQYFEELSFLKQHIIQRGRSNRMKRKSEILPKDEQSPDKNSYFVYFENKPPKTEFVDTSQSAFEEPADTNESFVLSASEAESIASFQGESQGESSIASKSNSAKGNSVGRVDEDEDDKFGRAIAADLKNIPFGKKKLKLKANIYKLLCEAIEEDS